MSKLFQFSYSAPSQTFIKSLNFNNFTFYYMECVFVTAIKCACRWKWMRTDVV